MSDGNGKLPATLGADYAKRLMSGIAESRASSALGGGGGKPLLRMLKSGEWVFSQENVEVQTGSEWVINIASLGHGWCCWVEGAGNNKNSLQGEAMAPMTDPKPARPLPINGTEFKEQRAFEAKCRNGEDAGTEVLYKTNSYGGLKETDALLAAIFKQLASDPEYAFPVVRFETDHYIHGKWGQIYTPMFTIVGWADMNGQDRAVAPALPDPKPAPAPEPPPPPPPAAASASWQGSPIQPAPAAAPLPWQSSPVPPPATPRKARAKPPVGSAAPAVAVVAAAAAPVTGQRRRPMSR